MSAHQVTNYCAECGRLTRERDAMAEALMVYRAWADAALEWSRLETSEQRQYAVRRINRAHDAALELRRKERGNG